uniref:Synaptic vesicle glycoprotein 2 n=1 Tax=Cryptocotyle lingua TaxID=66766 RepID=A0A7U0YEU9_9TREM|nr:synaptic vesicle glycoprotein 2 [Cryptocotyle lingua]
MMPRRPRSRQGVVQAVLDQLGFGWYQVRIIVILGIAQATDTMEALIQAILGPTLRCEWNLSSDYVALLATMVFLGVCIGSPPLGYASDQLGRKSLAILCCLALTYMTWLCAISPTYTWLATLRFLSGFYISGLLTAGNSMISEFLPETYQSTGQLLVCSFDSFVALYVTGVGFGCLVHNLSWRFFLMFTTPPLLLCALGLWCCVHESPVILAHWGRRVEAAQVLDAVARTNNRVPKQVNQEPGKPSEPYSFVGRLHNIEEREEHEFSSSGLLQILRLFVSDYAMSTILLIGINFIWGMIMYGGTTLLPVELPSAPRTCLQDISTGILRQHVSDNNNTRRILANEDCCLPLLKEGYLSLLSSMLGSILNFPIALGLIVLIGRRWTINVCFLLTAIVLFIEAFCLPSNALRVLFLITRAVASAGYNSTTIYLTGLYSPQIRSLAYGVMSTFYRIGVLTAPYLGQVFLHRVSALGAVLIFSGLAIIGFIWSLFLPHADSIRPRDGPRKARKIFRNIFKPRAPVTAAVASAAAAGFPEEELQSTGVSSIDLYGEEKKHPDADSFIMQRQSHIYSGWGNT